VLSAAAKRQSVKHAQDMASLADTHADCAPLTPTHRSVRAIRSGWTQTLQIWCEGWS